MGFDRYIWDVKVDPKATEVGRAGRWHRARIVLGPDGGNEVVLTPVSCARWESLVAR